MRRRLSIQARGLGLAALILAAPVAFVQAQTSVVIQNPLGSTTTLCGLIKNLLNVILALGVPVSVLFLVYAGFLLIWARGNTAALEKAKRNLRYVIIGIAVFLGAWALGQVIANTVNAVAQGSGVNFSINSCN